MKQLMRVGAFLLLLLYSQPAFGRDWQKHPAIVSLGKVRRVVATGDVHGALPQLLATLSKVNLIATDKSRPGEYRWTGGKTVWVSLGDYVDRGDYSLEVLHFIMNMQGQAEAVGGKVITLMGNHEVMLLNGDVARRARYEERQRKKYRPYGKTVKSFEKLGIPFRRIVSKENKIGRFLRNLPIMAVINGRFGFVHAGFGQVTSLENLRSSFQQCANDDNWNCSFLAPRTEEEAQASPIWARNWWEDKKHVDQLLQNLGLNELIFAHTPNGLIPRSLLERRRRVRQFIKSGRQKFKKRRMALYERRLAILNKEVKELSSTIQTTGRLFNLDIGMCPWYKMSNGGCLEIISHKGSAVFRAVYPDRPTALLKSDPFEAKVIEGVEETL